MSTTLLEHPSISRTLPPSSECIEQPTGLVCTEQSAGWLSRMILKSYIRNFHLCLDKMDRLPQRILEVGAGDGTLALQTATRFSMAKMIGIGFDPGKVLQARQKASLRLEFLELADTETLPFESGSFDLVISHGFLGNSPVPRHWLKEMSRVTADAMIVSAPTPVGYKWLRKLPGADDASLIGNPIFTPKTQPIALRQLKSWVERLELKTEAMTTPIPYGMLLSRKS